ncbi:hypothetical protein [Spiroplasma endosymbiont of Monopis laevigella]|uniref:hypothetical protein n=1 Tax=Spiroplasma endosymbiont of Monopis laevigella TaxID=3066312 RepID=UPI0030CA66EB
MPRNKTWKAWNLSKINLAFKIVAVFLIHFALSPQTIKFAWSKFSKNKLPYFSINLAVFSAPISVFDTLILHTALLLINFPFFFLPVQNTNNGWVTLYWTLIT